MFDYNKREYIKLFLHRLPVETIKKITEDCIMSLYYLEYIEFNSQNVPYWKDTTTILDGTELMEEPNDVYFSKN